MIAPHSDQFFLIDLTKNKSPEGSPVSVHSFADRGGGNLADRLGGRLINGAEMADLVDLSGAIGIVYPGDVLTVRTEDGHRRSYTGALVYLADGRLIFVPTDGQVPQKGVLLDSSC